MWTRVTPLLPTLIAVVVVHQVCSAPSPQVDSPCASNRDCNSETTYLTCSKGKCRCGTVSLFDSSQGVCLVYPGGSCDVSTSGRGRGKKCIKNAVCQSKSRGATLGECKCDDAYEEVSDGSCEKKNGSEATTGTSLLLVISVLVGSYFTTRWSIGV